jgi:hypothetical protein
VPQVFKIKRSTSADTVPTTSNLEAGEIAINLADSKLFVRDSLNNILELTTRTLGSFDDIYISEETNNQAMQYNSSNNRWENATRNPSPWTTGSGLLHYTASGSKVSIGKNTHSSTYNLEIDGGFNSAGQITLGSGLKVSPSFFHTEAISIANNFTIPTSFNAESTIDTAIETDVTITVTAGSVWSVTDLVTTD